MRIRQLFQPKLADRLQHCQSRRAFSFRLTQEALAQKRFEYIYRSWRTHYRLSRFQRASTHEHCQPAKHPFLIGIQQVITPLNCIAQSLLTGGHIARTACKYLQGRPLQFLKHCFGWKQFDTRRSQLKRQW
jgi:hypothetical protein